MNSVSSSFLFLTIIFLAKNIECQEDIHFELSVQYFSEDCKRDVHWIQQCQKRNIPWVISDFLPQLNNAINSTCSESNWNLVSQGSPTSLQKEFINWNYKNQHIPPDSEKVLKNRYEEFKSCISRNEAVNSPSKYLTQPSILHSKYNISDILRQSNITPGNNYTYQEISDAVTKFTHGRKPIIKCLWNHHLNTFALDQITLFFDESLNLIDPLKYYYLGKCPPNSPILYWSEGSNWQSLSARAIYDDPSQKYPTLREDNNGYYIFKQQHEPARCNIEFPSKCDTVNYPWLIRTFTFAFKENVDFSCEPSIFSDSNEPRNLKKFNLTTLSSIQNVITEKWTSVRANYSEEKDIGHLWNFQGKCSTYFKGIDTELKFFKKSLELFDKYNLDKILQQSNITPGNNYTYQEIFDVVSKAIDGKPPIIECDNYFHYDRRSTTLSRIGFYLDNNLNPVDPTDIDTPFDTQYNCKRDKLLYYQDTQGYIDEMLRSYESYVSHPVY